VAARRQALARLRREATFAAVVPESPETRPGAGARSPTALPPRHRQYGHAHPATLLGAWIGDQFTAPKPPGTMNAVTDFEAATGKRPSLIEFSSTFAR